MIVCCFFGGGNTNRRHERISHERKTQNQSCAPAYRGQRANPSTPPGGTLHHHNGDKPSSACSGGFSLLRVWRCALFCPDDRARSEEPSWYLGPKRKGRILLAIMSSVYVCIYICYIERERERYAYMYIYILLVCTHYIYIYIYIYVHTYIM